MHPKKRVLVIGPGMEIGGVERSLIGLLNSFDYDQVDVDLFLLSHTGEFMPYIPKKANLLPENKLFSHITVPILSLAKQGHFLSAAARLYAKLAGGIRSRFTKCGSVNTTLCNKIFSSVVKKFPKEYDLALGFFGPHYLLNKKVRAKQKIGWVHTDYTNSAENLDVQYVFPFWNGLDRIACVSDGVRDSFVKLFPSLKDKAIVIENIIDPQFVRSQAEEIDITKEMPVDGSFRILSVGRFCTAKAFDEAIQACKILRDQGFPVKWYFIGYGPDEEKLKKLIEEQKSEDYTILLGKKSNPYPYMRACDLYAQPSRYEGKAVTVREAQILGKPVMITDFATAKSQLTDGVDGYICPMGVAGIVSGIRYLYTHSEVRSKLVLGCGTADYSNKNSTIIFSGYFSK